ncbi:MAG: SUMF1/EgtB/PvdO family nonheme iron enzyme [Candidatus Delongbacteria bacterium]
MRKYLKKKYKEAVFPKMITVKGGSFRMGGTESDESPVHNVTVSDFYIGKTEVTQSQMFGRIIERWIFYFFTT